MRDGGYDPLLNAGSVGRSVRPDRFEWDALEAMLTDPSRVLPGGVTVGALAGSGFDQLASDVRKRFVDQPADRTAARLSVLLMLTALQAGVSNKEWYGSPWWPDIVSVIIELLDDLASSAWKYDEHREPVPSAASDHAALEGVLLEKPESLDDEAIYWCLKHGLSRSATLGASRAGGRAVIRLGSIPNHGSARAETNISYTLSC